MGAVLGGLIVFYALGKLIEWVVLKRVLRNFGAMVWASSAIVFGAIAGLWFMSRHQPYAFHPAMFVDYAIAAVSLPILRIFWRKRKLAKEKAISG